NALYNLRAWDAARTHLEQGIAFSNAPQPRAQGVLTGTHEGVFSRIRLAQVLWELGYPDQAVQRSHEALTLARELAHPTSGVPALFFTADIHMRECVPPFIHDVCVRVVRPALPPVLRESRDGKPAPPSEPACSPSCRTSVLFLADM